MGYLPHLLPFPSSRGGSGHYDSPVHVFAQGLALEESCFEAATNLCAWLLPMSPSRVGQYCSVEL
jgi:hypothetical protein